MMEEYWKNSDSVKDDNIALVSMKSSYRIGYNWGMGSDASLMTTIEEKIRQLHSQVGNAETEGRYIVFGASFEQLYSAAMYSSNRGSVTAVTGGIDTVYPKYWKNMVDYYVAKHFKWVDGQQAVDWSR